MSVEKSKLRGYRRGLPFRNGDIKVEQFLDELKFKGIKYSDGYSEGDKRIYLNYTYDALKDLASILNIPVEIISLLNIENDKPYLVFGETDKSYKNFVLSKEGLVVKNWVTYLDKYIGNELGLSDGLFNKVSADMNDIYSQATKSLLQVLKFKEKLVDKNSITSEKLENFREEMFNLMEKMPFKADDEYANVAALDTSRNIFFTELSDESFNNMVETFESRGLFFGEVKNEIYNLMLLARQEKEDVLKSNINSDLVHTDYYNSIMVTNNHSNLSLITTVVEYYVNYKLKATGCYNNFLVNQSKLNDLAINSEEFSLFYPAVEKFLMTILEPIVNKLSGFEMVKKDLTDTEVKNNNLDNNGVNNDSEDNLSEMIDKNLSEDKGKFKLTLFKKLAKDSGLNISLSKTDKNENQGVYYVEFIDSYIKYIKPAIFNNPTQKSHCINIYMGDLGDTKQGYWWDYELDYQDLVNYLLNIEKSNIKKVEVEKVEKNKFKLSAFKDACLKVGLKVDTSESKVVQNKYIIGFNNSYIVYITPPVHLVIGDSEMKFKVKTLREELYYSWSGQLDYKDLISKLVEIENQGQEAMKQEKAEIKKAKTMLDKEKKELINQVEQTKKEKKAYENKINNELKDILDCSNIVSTKDLRDKLNKYIILKGYRLQVPMTVSSVISLLQNNIYSIDGKPYKVELAVIPEKGLKGKSKAWAIKEDVVLIQRRLDNRKQLEGLIESFVNKELKTKNLTKVQRQMFEESLTFMFCKLCNLDVRTYCNSELFERFIKSGSTNVSSYINKSLKLFDNLMMYFN